VVNQSTIRILIVDDHYLIREGVSVVIGETDDMTIVGEAVDGLHAIKRARDLSPDVVLMDVFMPNMNGVEATSAILRNHPWMKVIILTISDAEGDLYSAIEVGASGYLLKNCRPSHLVDAIRRVMHGEVIITKNLGSRLLDDLLDERAYSGLSSSRALTQRERDVLELVSAGLHNREIAAKLVISEHTVKTHLRHIMEKYHLRNRAQAAAYITYGFEPFHQSLPGTSLMKERVLT